MKRNTVKDVSEIVRYLLSTIYCEGFQKNKIPCHRTYSESYNKGKSWRYKWYLLDSLCENEVVERMIMYTNKILNDRMKLLFGVSVNLHYSSSGQSLILIAKPI